jgi:glycosyltransferase involved in cell wall biosynthesis
MLAVDHEVHLVAACWDREDQGDLARLPVASTGVSMSRVSAVVRASASVLGRRPLQQAYLDSRSIRNAISAAERDFDPDVVYFNTLRSAQWRSRVHARLAIDLDEFRSDYYRQLSNSSSNALWRFIARLEARRMIREESRIIDEFEVVLVSSPTDLRPDKAQVRLVRSPDALISHPSSSRSDLGRDVVFVGRLNYAANVSAIIWFADKVWPEVTRRVPGARLHIVGDSPGDRVQSLACESVEIHGRVPEVDPHYKRARATIVPVMTATGVQMKLIEALQLAVPTVVSPIVAKLAGVRHEVEVLVASSPEEWQSALIRLLTEDELARRMSVTGHEWATRTYSRVAIARTLQEAFEPLTTTR